MSEEPDLDAYLHRIGYTGTPRADLDTLRGIHLQHALTIPFENLNPILRQPVRLDLPSLEQKLVRSGRGGYCFEQNILLSSVLRAIGFQVTELAARVTWNAPPGALRPRTHMLLRIDLDDGPYLADAGFGGLTLTAPLRLVPDIEQPTPHETFRLSRVEGGFTLEAMVRDAWKTLYRFDLQPQLRPDYEVANWFVATHPESHFLSVLMAGRAFPGGRFALLNNQLTVYHLEAASEQRVLRSAAELRTVLQESFGIALPEGPGLEEALSRLAASAASGEAQPR